MPGKSDRVATLLRKLGLTSRLIKDEQDYIQRREEILNEEINYNEVERKLSEMREVSMTFLVNCYRLMDIIILFIGFVFLAKRKYDWVIFIILLLSSNYMQMRLPLEFYTTYIPFSSSNIGYIFVVVFMSIFQGDF